MTLAWCVCFAFLALSAQLQLVFYDDGILLTATSQLAHGQRLYKDLWTLYSPGQFYALLALFSVFGKNLLVYKGWGVAAKASIAVIFYALLRSATPRWYAVAWTLVLLVTLAVFVFDGFPVLPALVFILLALFQLSREAAYGKHGAWFRAGLLLACAGVFRHDLAVYALAAFVFCAVACRPRTAVGSRDADTLKRLASLLVGGLIIAMPVATYFLATVGWLPLYEAFLLDPANVYAPNRRLPWPAAWGGMDASAYFPYAVAALFSAILVIFGKPRQAPWLVLLCVCMLMLSVKGWVRTGFFHMLQALVPALLLFCILLYQHIAQKKWLPILMLSVAFVVLWAPLLGQAGKHVANQWRINVPLFVRGCADTESVRVDCLMIDPDQARAVQWLQNNTPPESCIYIGPDRHDRVFINAVAVYYLVDRSPCTRWYETHPGLQTRADIQDAMLREFQQRPPSAVVLDSRWAKVREPNQSSQSSGVMLLDDYLRGAFEPAAQFGSVTAYLPR